MTTYTIDFTDPLRQGFAIAPGSFDGPGGDTAKTSLRLYGRGALEWGEAVDENLVRLNENFSGATAPLVPIAGQLWLRQSLYVKNGASFFRWNIAGGAWENITGSVTTTAGTIGAYNAGVTIGQYVYSTADLKLYRWDTPYRQATAIWLPRSLTVQGTNPTTQKPAQDLLLYDEYTQAWIQPKAVAVGDTIIGLTGSYDGQLFYDTAEGILYIWNAEESSWQQILGPSNTVGGPQDLVSNGNIDMTGTYTMINVPTPTDVDLTNVANVDYVQTYTAAYVASQASNFVPAVGPGTMTGTYTLNNTQLNLTGTGGISLGGTGGISLGTNKITNLGAPVAGTDAVNLDTLNSSVAAALVTVSTTAPIINPLSGEKDGDIRVSGTDIDIWAGGAWRRVFPALYS